MTANTRADGENIAWSVVLRGAAELLAEYEAHGADDLESLPWVLPETPKYNVVRIQPTVVTGRRFRLSRTVPRPA